MTSKENQMFREAAQVLLTLLRCISMKRALNCTEEDKLNLFRVYDGCLMDTIAVSWCKLFGSEREDLHWKNLYPNTATSVQQALSNELETASDGFDALSEKLRNYRDTYVAHHDLDTIKRATNHPKLDPLQKTGQILYKRIHNTLSGVGQDQQLPKPDAITGSQLSEIDEHWRKIVDAVRCATKDFYDCPPT